MIKKSINNNDNNNHDDNISELTQFLLDHDRGAVTKRDNQGHLPLHIACSTLRDFEIIELLFNAHPEAIYSGLDEFTLLEYIRRTRNSAGPFFESQLNFVQQAREDTTPDENGQLPIHRLLQNTELTLGAIKLIMKSNPAIKNATDNEGRIPLHIAINYADVKIVKYLIEANPESLTVSD